MSAEVRTINSATDAGAQVPLPAEVREESTAFTTVYEQGKMIYDGAAARAGDQQAAATREAMGDGAAPSSLNEMLKWGITNSSPEQLKQLAAEGRQPTQMDREIMDMMLGEPIVAKMRACLGKLPKEAGDELPEGLDAALAALEELEYYVEDIDNAVDMAKIGGLQALLGCVTQAEADPELREAACGVLAAAMQNNPKVQEACVAVGVLGALQPLLSACDDGELLPLTRKALLATSALVRASPDALAQLTASAGAVATLVSLGAHADPKLRRRALFLMLNLSRDSPPFGALLTATPGVGEMVVEGATDLDEDTREQALGLALLLSESAPSTDLRRAMVAADAPKRLARAAADARVVGAAEGNPEHASQLRLLLAWLSEAD